MIASIRGKLEALSGDGVVVNVSGVGFRVYMPTSSLSTLGAIGDDIWLHTHLHLWEDNITLYGFTSANELRLFQTLISVSGLGPRLALAMLSAMSVEKLEIAIATGSVDLLTVVSGVGKKTASRLILELKDKISTGLAGVVNTEFVHDDNEVLSVLTSLGYSVAEATRAVASIPSSSNISLEEKIKLALQHFGGK
ncbi:Holliday junction branch migration protein RuvA [Chloroflexota bacterium]